MASCRIQLNFILGKRTLDEVHRIQTLKSIELKPECLRPNAKASSVIQ